LSRSLPTRYARALADLAMEAGKLDEVGKQLEEICRIWEENPPYQSLFFTRPGLDLEEQIVLLSRLLDTLEIGGLSRAFLLFLLQKGRFSLLTRICHRYRELADARMERVRVTLSVAFPLSEEDSDSIQDAFRQRIGKEVVLRERQDPSLLGGWVAQIGSSELWDASVKGELQRIRARLLRGEDSFEDKG